MRKKKYKAHIRPHRFCEMPTQNFDQAEIVIIPVPYDATATFKTGTRDGPQAIINASKHLDEPWGENGWHPLIKKEFVYTLDEIMLYGGSPKKQLESLYNFIAEEIIAQKKIPFLLGGEHSLTYSAIKALYAKNKDFSILHFDAHPDLRDSYNGERLSHSCALRRSIEIGKNISLTSVGIRSVDRDTQAYINKKYERPNRNINIFYAPDLPTHDIRSTLKEKVYITVDLDVFDPAFIPAVGTPQPGGLSWYPVIHLLANVIRAHTIIGMDIVELAPIPGNVISEVTAAKLMWNMIEMYYNKKYYIPTKIR